MREAVIGGGLKIDKYSSDLNRRSAEQIIDDLFATGYIAVEDLVSPGLNRALIMKIMSKTGLDTQDKLAKSLGKKDQSFFSRKLKDPGEKKDYLDVELLKLIYEKFPNHFDHKPFIYNLQPLIDSASHYINNPVNAQKIIAAISPKDKK